MKMKLAVKVSLLFNILSSCLCLPETVASLTLPIGAIFNSQEDQTSSAFRFAVKQFNSRQGRPFTLNISMEITEIEDNFKMASTVCDQMIKGVFLILGKKDVRSLDIIQSITNTFHMPYLSPSLSKDTARLENGTFEIHMKPPHTQAIIDVIVHFGWTKVHYLYDSDEGLHRLQHIYAAVRGMHMVSFLFRRMPDVYNAHDDLRKLDKMESDTPKLIVLDMSSDSAYKSILKQIPEVGMNKYGYHYLLASMDILGTNLRRYVHGGVNVTGFQLVKKENPAVRDFISKFRSSNRKKYPGSRKKLSSETAMVVDAVGLIWRAFTAMIDEDLKVFRYAFRRRKVYNYNKTVGIPCTTKPPIPWMHGDAIIAAIKNITFEGLTGHVAFDDNGLRQGYLLDVYSLELDKLPNKTGVWDPSNGYRNINGDAQESRNQTFSRKAKIVTTILSPPFLMERENLNGNPIVGNERYEGYVYDLAERVAAIMKFEFILQVVPDGQYGRLSAGKWSGMVAELVEGRADMAIADLSITYDREKNIDFTKPFMNFGISIMIKKPEIVKPGVFSFMEPISLNVWICIIFGYLLVSLGLFLVSRCSPYEWRKVTTGKTTALQNDFSLLNSFWFSMGALMLQGNDISPRSVSGRIIGTVWWFFVLIIISSYTANLAAFLTIERLLMPIDEAEDLLLQNEIKYGTIESGSTRKFFETSTMPVFADMYRVMLSSKPSAFVKSTLEGINRVKKAKGKYAFFLESPVNEYHNNREPCDTIRVGANLNSKGYGIATPENSEIRDGLNLAVLELIEKGILHKLKTSWWKDKGQCNADSDGSKKRSLSLSNVAGVFYILVGGLVLAVILGSSELLCKKSKLFMQSESYMRGTETAVTIVTTPNERENGGIVDFTPEYTHTGNSTQETVHRSRMMTYDTYTEANNAHTDV